MDNKLPDDEISENALICIYTSIKNMDKVVDQKPIDFEELSKYVDDDDEPKLQKRELSCTKREHMIDEYDTTIDSENRVTLIGEYLYRDGSVFRDYSVAILNGGIVFMEPNCVGPDVLKESCFLVGLIKRYDCVIDMNNRVTIRRDVKGIKYHVTRFKAGVIVMEPIEG